MLKQEVIYFLFIDYRPNVKDNMSVLSDTLGIVDN